MHDVRSARRGVLRAHLRSYLRGRKNWQGHERLQQQTRYPPMARLREASCRRIACVSHTQAAGGALPLIGVYGLTKKKSTGRSFGVRAVVKWPATCPLSSSVAEVREQRWRRHGPPCQQLRCSTARYCRNPRERTESPQAPR